ncbi:MAG: signal peptidase I [Thermotogae bacterium]|nr:signal peptidase I [Thermotogota bacterium]
MRGWLYTILIVLLIRAFLIQAYVIPTGSMEDTLLPGDFLFVFKPIYGIVIPLTPIKIPERVLPKRRDIVVFRFPYEPKDYVKRTIGLPGDTVEIINKQVYINGRPLKEPYVVFKDRRIIEWPYDDISPEEFQRLWESGELMDAEWVRDNFGPVVVPDGKIFVLGDNRDFSWDSRFWGPLDVKYLRGRPLIIYFSWDPKRRRIRFNRIFRIVWNW